MDKAQQYLALARKAGKLVTGEEACGVTMDEGRGKLLLLAADASGNAARRAEGFRQGRRAAFAALPWGKDTLGALLGTGSCSMACFTDLGLATEFAAALSEEGDAWKELSALLAARRDKARRRKAAPRKHRINGDKGGKKDGN